MMVKIKHGIVSIQNQLTLRAVLGRKYSKPIPASYTRLGSSWGGWWVESAFLFSPTERILISAGLGGDISFEKENKKNGVKIVGIDPDPRCHEYLDSVIPPNFFLSRITAALSDQTGSSVLYKFDEKNFDSWTHENLAGQRSISQNFQTIGILDLYRGLDLTIEFHQVYLKMDIEGSEEIVLSSVIENQLKLVYLAVEFDFLNLIPALSLRTRFAKIKNAKNLLAGLQSAGYELEFHEDFNFYWKFQK
jgi:FkbM family methyltransferase